ncbi:MAG: hypothetical protein GEV07_29690 [Streptosporangiales bacterium]|nr:hypothetical protein [Streptosporangiales bacterium]
MAIRGKPANPDKDPKKQEELDNARRRGGGGQRETVQRRGHQHYTDRDGSREPGGRTTGKQDPRGKSRD